MINVEKRTRKISRAAQKHPLLLYEVIFLFSTVPIPHSHLANKSTCSVEFLLKIQERLVCPLRPARATRRQTAARTVEFHLFCISLLSKDIIGINTYVLTSLPLNLHLVVNSSEVTSC